jgi:hypothetical protein
MRIHLTRRVKRIIAIPLYFILAGGIDLLLCILLKELAWLATVEGVIDTFIFMAIYSLLWEDKMPRLKGVYTRQQMLLFTMWIIYVKGLRRGDPVTSDDLQEWETWEENYNFSKKTALNPINN